MKHGWFERELGGLFLTFHELFVAVRLRRLAPFLASVLLVTAAGVVLLVLLDLLAIAYGQITQSPLGHTPRSIAGIAIFGGYYVWDHFACAERIALLESLDASTPPGRRFRRRLKAAAFLALLVAVCGELAGG